MNYAWQKCLNLKLSKPLDLIFRLQEILRIGEQASTTRQQCDRYRTGIFYRMTKSLPQFEVVKKWGKGEKGVCPELKDN